MRSMASGFRGPHICLQASGGHGSRSEDSSETVFRVPLAESLPPFQTIPVTPFTRWLFSEMAARRYVYIVKRAVAAQGA